MTNNTTRQNCNKTHLCKMSTGNSRYAKYIKGTLYACLSAGIREIPTEFSRKRTPRHSGVVCLPRQKLSCFLNSLPPPPPNECVGESSSGIVSSYRNPGFVQPKYDFKKRKSPWKFGFISPLSHFEKKHSFIE